MEKPKKTINFHQPGKSIESILPTVLQDEQPIIPGPEVGDDRRPDLITYDSNNLTEADNTKFIKENYSDGKHQDD